MGSYKPFNPRAVTCRTPERSSDAFVIRQCHLGENGSGCTGLGHTDLRLRHDRKTPPVLAFKWGSFLLFQRFEGHLEHLEMRGLICLVFKSEPPR